MPLTRVKSKTLKFPNALPEERQKSDLERTPSWADFVTSSLRRCENMQPFAPLS
jgi:hypothetical protein